MPALPKRNPARRNQATTKATLSADHDLQTPPLPANRVWQRQTLDWWVALWESPMAPEYDDSDVHGLVLLALLVDDFWATDDPKLRKELSGEIRLQRQCFGLTPIDRRRLQWEIERTDEAQDRGRRRRGPEKPPADRKPAADPRRLLHSVS